MEPGQAKLIGSDTRTINLDEDKNQDVQNLNIDGVDFNEDREFINKEDTSNSENNFTITINGREVASNEFVLNETIGRMAKDKVNSLETADEVLQYIKNVYSIRYSEGNNGENIQNVKLVKSKLQAVYKDTAENGDEILREGRTYPLDADQTTTLSMYAVDENGESVKEMAYYDKDGYITVYDKDEEVDEYSRNTLAKLGGVISAGIDYYENFENSSKSGSYKETLIKALEKYMKKELIPDDLEKIVQAEDGTFDEIVDDILGLNDDEKEIEESTETYSSTITLENNNEEENEDIITEDITDEYSVAINDGWEHDD